MSSTAQKTDNAPAGTGAMDAVEEVRETALAVYNAEVLDSAPGVREAFMTMLAEVPDPPDDAVVRIVQQILTAEYVEDLDKPWDAEGMRDLVGRVLRVDAIHKMPSDYVKGLGTYLVCQVTVPETGEQLVVSTGSVSIVAQLVRAYTLGALPLAVVPHESEKPSKNGYRPMHLEVVKRARTS